MSKPNPDPCRAAAAAACRRIAEQTAELAGRLSDGNDYLPDDVASALVELGKVRKRLGKLARQLEPVLPSGEE